jgi:hypothetical protein
VKCLKMMCNRVKWPRYKWSADKMCILSRMRLTPRVGRLHMGLNRIHKVRVRFSAGSQYEVSF